MKEEYFNKTVGVVMASLLPQNEKRELIDSLRAMEKETKNNGWIPVEERLSENDNYILVSFDNFSMPDIARYEEDKEGGVFYPGDEEQSYVSFGLFVNAWQPLPEPYREETEDE